MKKFLLSVFFLTFGAFVAAFAIEGFLVPNKIIDGGIIGISIMCAYKTSIELGIWAVVLNLPFIFLAWKKMGKTFVFSTIYAVLMFAIGVTAFPIWLHGRHVSDPFLACIFGGLILGTGVGLILRSNGSLDGTEIVAIRVAKRWGFSVGEIIMFFNLFIFVAAGFVFNSWQSAMYSMITYFIAYRVIDIVIEGLNESKSIFVISDHAQDIGKVVMESLDVSVTYLEGRGGYSQQAKEIVYCVINRLEVAKFKNLVKSIDPCAFMAVENVHEVEGTRIKNNKTIC